MYTLIKLFHLAAAIVWLGGMTFMLFALRPVLMSQLEGPSRLRFLTHVLQRFFSVVMAAIVVLLLTGLHLYGAGAKAAGMANMPLGWHLMFGLGLAMMLVFGHLYFAGFQRLKRAVLADDWPLAASRAALVHKLVVLNFTLGWAAIIALRLFA